MSKEIDITNWSIKRLRDELAITIDAMAIEVKMMESEKEGSNLWYVHQKAYASLAIDRATLQQKISDKITWRWIGLFLLVFVSLICYLLLK